ncbi:MAG TPA: glycosyltransferase family 1 protein, partial [Epsilonproteobacteria bacterium]|nr:glycosyltransferase family 1 protein [Campylobacterota bacterium]
TAWNIYNFRSGLIHALQSHGYKVICIAPYDSYAEKLEAMGCEFHPVDFKSKGTNPIDDLKLIRNYYKLYRSLPIDIILHYTIKPNIYGSIAAKLSGTPMISNISGLGTVFLDEKSLSSKVAKLLYKIAIRFPNKVFFQNPADKALFIDKKLVPKEIADLIPGSGINTEVFKPQPLSSTSDKGSVKFLLIARLLKDKGIVEYVNAARHVHQTIAGTEQKVVFDLLGDYYTDNPTAITQDEIKQWEAEGIIRHLGHSDDVKSVIAAYDSIVLPSYREGLSRVLLEASSMAKPAITTDVPGCRDVVEDGYNGFLCQVKDVDSLTEQIMKFLHLTPAERETMGCNGRQKILEQFDEKVVIQKYLDAIKAIVG